MIGAIGDDQYGSFCLRDLERHGVDISGIITRENETTSFAIAVSDTKTGERSFMKRLGTARRISYEEAPLEYLKSIKFFFISILDDAVEQMVQTAKTTGARIVVDADTYSDRLMELLPDIDVFIASEYVYSSMFASGEPEPNCLEVMEKGPGIVVFTFGVEGCAGISKDGFFKIPAFKVKTVDTVGAGDVFHGAFMAGLLRGLPTDETARFASAAAAIKCTRIGGRAGIPDLKTLERFLWDGTIDYTEIDERVRFYSRGFENV